VPKVQVSVRIRASPAEVWEVLGDVASHVDWMEDAVAIRFTSRRRAGVGTAFDCDTRIGPFRLVDHMEITEWRPRRAMGVRHTAVVTGTGRFTLRRRRGATLVTWEERLRFPWWFGGPLGATAARAVLRRVWRRNLRNLKAVVEG
jgi:hypothetical protein